VKSVDNKQYATTQAFCGEGKIIWDKERFGGPQASCYVPDISPY